MAVVALRCVTLRCVALQFLLEALKFRDDFVDRLGALGGVFGKEILLPDGIEFDRFAIAGGFRRRDHDADRVLVDAVFDHRILRKDGPDGVQGRPVFLVAAVSVFRIGDGEFERSTHGGNSWPLGAGFGK